MRSVPAILLAAVVTTGCSAGKPGPTTEERIRALEQEVERQKREAHEYAPKMEGRIDDLGMPAAELLRQLPSVADVEVLVAPARPTHRIIHLRDWHYVPPDLFALDVRQASGKPLPDEEVDALYRESLLEIELVQSEQATLLRCLVKHHGLHRVLAEGLTPQGMSNFRDVIAAFRATDRRLNDLREQRADLKGEAPAIDRQIDELAWDHRRRMLEYGGSGQLVLSGKVEVLPLDDEATLAAAKPVTPDGRVRVDPASLEARHDAQVKAALASGPCSLLILGGSHDLSASVRRQGGRVEYVRITTERYKQFAGGTTP